MADGLEPICLAMVISDAVYIDSASGKRSLLGLFSGFASRDFPMPVHAIAVYIALTGCRGRCRIAL